MTTKSDRSIKKIVVFCIYMLAAFIIFYHISDSPIQEWDESRRGINAHTMIQSGDYWNYRYLSQFDNFNTKPPLFTWVLAGSFSAIGVSNFALRLPNAIFFLLLFLLVDISIARHTEFKFRAILLCILLSAEGLVGLHVGRSGDTDMLFVLGISVFFIGFYKVATQQKTAAWLYASILGLILAILTKGIAIGLIIPGVCVWGFWNKELVKKNISFLKPTLTTLTGFIFTVILLLNFQNELSSWTEKNILYDMIYNDGITRFSDSSMENNYNFSFIPNVLDIKFGPFIYIIYAWIIIVSVLYLSRKRAMFFEKHSFLHYCNCITITALLLLFFSQNKHQWYVAPLIFPLAYIATTAIMKIRPSIINWIAIPFILVIFLKKAYNIDLKHVEASKSNAPTFFYDTAYLSIHSPQDKVFTFITHNKNTKIITYKSESEINTEAIRHEIDNLILYGVDLTESSE